MKKNYLLFFLAITSFFVQAQDRCGMDLVTNKLMENNSKIKSELSEFDRFIQSSSEKVAINTREVLSIPVVVHVIYRNDAENIPDSRIYDQIDILNKDYARQNSNRVNTPSAFQSVAGTADIRFYLTTKDENGQPTSGITRDFYETIASNGYVESVIKQNTAWDTKRFLNIWVLRMPNQNILGYAYLPLPSILNTNKDGLVVDYQHFGYVNSVNNGRTATHELGHFLGLKHPWGDQESCNVDDGVSDTPPTSGPFYGCPSYPQSKCSKSSMFMNFMDYVNDPCMNMFSKGQVNVMRSVLLNKRRDLVQTEDVGCANLDIKSVQMGFEANEPKSRWTKEDTNQDGNTWNFSNEMSDQWGPNQGTGYANYQWNDNDHSKGGDDYLFTPCIDIKKDVVYEISFSYACAADENTTYPEKLEVGFSAIQGSRDFTVINDDWKLDINNAYPSYKKISYKFNTQKDATISIGFHAISDPNQYTLQIDDIQIRNTEATATDEVASLAGISITPNPASDIFYWNILNPVYNTGKITLYDLLGHEVISLPLNQNESQKAIDISQLSPAIYIVESILDGKRYSGKLVVTD